MLSFGQRSQGFGSDSRSSLAGTPPPSDRGAVADRGKHAQTGLPATLSRALYVPGASALGVSTLRGYDVAPDGRFLMIKESASGERDGGPTSLVVRLNLAKVLNERFAAK
jgi:hypothetical protein